MQNPKSKRRKRSAATPRGAPPASPFARISEALAGSPFHRAHLTGPSPDRFLCYPGGPRRGDEAQAKALLAGRFSAPPEEIDCGGDATKAFDLVVTPGRLFDALHGWTWLDDLATLREDAPGEIRRISEAWCDRFESYSPAVWRAPLLGERLLRVCTHGELLLQGGDAVWRSRILSTVARQTRHLAHVGYKAPRAYDRLTAALALTLAGLCLPTCEDPLERGLELLRREARLQFRSDGGHLSRNPSKQLEIVLRLRQVLDAFERRAVAPPSFLRHLTARASDHLAIFRLGDGRLAVFNGGYEETSAAVAAAVAVPVGNDLAERAIAATTGGAIGYAKYSGYQRLESGRAVLVAEVGAPDIETGSGARPRARYDGVGSFHFASGRERLIVNCGAGARLGAEWEEALRQAPAHSTLSIDRTETSAAPEFGPSAHRRAENDDGQLIEMDRRFVLSPRVRVEPGSGGGCMRRLFLRHGGDELIGEDIIYRAPRGLEAPWSIRFHLAPAVRASIARDGRSALAVLPNGEGWRFKSNCRALTLERSVYCGAGGAPQASEQIVLSGRRLEAGDEGDMVVRWGWRRVAV